jgi:cell division transport system permease protein
VIALVSILFSLQVFTIIDRSISAYKENLSSNYALVIVSKKKLVEKDVLNSDKLFSTIVELSADDVIKRLNSGISKRNVKLLKLSLPKFYKIKLSQYPTPSDVKRLTKNLLKNKSIMKVENFSHNHDTTYKLLILFKTVIATFAMTIFVVTSLLIFKELRIWQFSHNERMNIMGLFGAPVWLRSAVLFRLAIVDALIASAISFILFTYLTQSSWLLMQFDYIGIKIVIFDQLGDFSILLSVAVVLSTILSAMTVLGHKEEV